MYPEMLSVFLIYLLFEAFPEVSVVSFELARMVAMEDCGGTIYH